MEDSRERMIRYLQDAHAAEVGFKKSLDGFMNDTDDNNLRSLFQEHINLTETQADRLEARLRAYDASPSGGKGFFNSMLASLSEMLHGAHDEYDKNVQNLFKAYAAECLERGMYEAMAAYSSAIGDSETAMLARQIQAEEEQTAQRIFPMISQYAAMTAGAAAGKRAYPL